VSNDPIAQYVAAAPEYGEVCRLLRAEIDRSMPKAVAKIWHAIPVWFVGEHPVVGFKAGARHVNLLFWNGQSFGDPKLTAAGKFKAAQIQFTDCSQVDLKALRRWLKSARTEIWDYRTRRPAA
jgi:hypothetical protein